MRNLRDKKEAKESYALEKVNIGEDESRYSGSSHGKEKKDWNLKNVVKRGHRRGVGAWENLE